MKIIKNMVSQSVLGLIVKLILARVEYQNFLRREVIDSA